MKVLFIIPSKNSITGASMAMINIILGISDKIDAYVVASKPPKQYEVFLERIEKKGARLFLVDSKRTGLGYWKELASKSKEVIEKNDIEIIHLHLPKLVYVLGDYIRKNKKKLVYTAEGDPIFEVKSLGIKTRLQTKLMWNKCKKFVDVICPCSHWLADILQKRDGFKSIIPIHNAIDYERFQNVTIDRKKIGIPENEFIITTAARLTPVKEIDTLLKGFADFVSNYPESQLIILGDGEQRTYLENLVETLDLKNQVKFLGFKNNPQDYIANSDVFVMTSNYEPFGMPAAEAGVLGKPTIVSNAGGLAEIIKHGETGYIFEVGNYKELSKYLIKLHDSENIQNFSELSKSRIRENFSPEVIGGKYLQVYKSLNNMS